MLTPRPRLGFVLFVALLGLATGCEPEPQTTPSAQTSSLQGRTFLLQSSVGFQPVPGTTVRLGFSAQEVSFNAGCNSYSGRYQLTDSVLTIFDLLAHRSV